LCEQVREAGDLPLALSSPVGEIRLSDAVGQGEPLASLAFGAEAVDVGRPEGVLDRKLGDMYSGHVTSLILGLAFGLASFVLRRLLKTPGAAVGDQGALTVVLASKRA
jgi:hypothetical protein